jgi:hypothetical protein
MVARPALQKTGSADPSLRRTLWKTYPLCCLSPAALLVGSYVQSERKHEKTRRKPGEIERQRTAIRMRPPRSPIGDTAAALNAPLPKTAAPESDHQLAERAIREPTTAANDRESQFKNEDQLAGPQRSFDANTKLQSESAELKRRLAQQDEALGRLRKQTADATRWQSESEEFRLETLRLREENVTLGERLQSSEERLNGMASEHEAAVERQAHLQTRLSESERQTVEATAQNRQLQEQVDAASTKLPAGEKSLEEFHLSQDRAHAENRQLLEGNRRLERECDMLREQLETSQTQRDDFARRNQEAAERNETLQIELLAQRQAALEERQQAERRAQEERENQRIEAEARANQLQEVRRCQETADRCAGLEAKVPTGSNS